MRKLKDSLRDELAELLRRLSITAIHVTHDQHEALAIADRLAIMQAGRIVGIGDGEALYRKPGHPFVAAFLGRVNRITRDDADRAARRIRLADAVWSCPAEIDQPAVLVRPEDIQIGPPGDGAATMKVVRRVFLGERVQLHLQPATGDARELALTAEVGRDHPIRRDEVVGIRIASDRWMPGEAAA
jgi:putative spermidine/putrescine transport system ATP-binding protein